MLGIVDFAGWFYICHNDYQELQSMVETGSLLLLLPGFDISVVHARTFFYLVIEDELLYRSTNGCSSAHTENIDSCSSDYKYIYINSFLGILSSCFDLSASIWYACMVKTNTLLEKDKHSSDLRAPVCVTTLWLELEVTTSALNAFCTDSWVYSPLFWHMKHQNKILRLHRRQILSYLCSLMQRKSFPK